MSRAASTGRGDVVERMRAAASPMALQESSWGEVEAIMVTGEAGAEHILALRPAISPERAGVVNASTLAMRAIPATTTALLEVMFFLCDSGAGNHQA
jgi:hypothetical protein